MNGNELAQTESPLSVVLELQKNAIFSFCVDIWERIAVIVREDLYPLSGIDKCIDSLGDAQVFTPLHTNRGYWKIEVDKADFEKTAFTLHRGMYQFTGILFRL